MPQGKTPQAASKMQVWLAIIGLAGVLGAALIANWKNIFPSSPSAALPGSEFAATPAQAPTTPPSISVRASEFVNGFGVAMASGQTAQYGDVLMNMGPPYTERPNAAEFQFRATKAGTYRLLAEYAAGDDRPVTILLNGQLVTANGLGARTGCFEATCQRWLNQGEVQLKAGLNVLRLERPNVFPHIRSFKFEPVQ